MDRDIHGWENLATFEKHDVWYATLADATWTLSLLDALPPRFICGLVCRKDNIPGFAKASFFRSLVAAGCRAIAIFADGDRSLEDAFDRVVIEAGCIDYEPTIWSTSHNSLYDMLAYVIGRANDISSAPIIVLGMIDTTIGSEVRAAMDDVERLYEEDEEPDD